jgi:hypothetical protein
MRRALFATKVALHENSLQEEHFLPKEGVGRRSSEVLAPSMAEAKELASHSAGQSQALQKSFQNGHINERPLAPY